MGERSEKGQSEKSKEPSKEVSQMARNDREGPGRHTQRSRQSLARGEPGEKSGEEDRSEEESRDTGITPRRRRRKRKSRKS